MLCFWQLNDENDLLAHSLDKLSEDVKVDSENIPSTIKPTNNDKNKPNNDKKSEIEFKASVKESFKEFSRGVTLNGYHKAKANIRSLKRELKNCDSEDEEDLKKDIAENEAIVDNLKKDLGFF